MSINNFVSCVLINTYSLIPSLLLLGSPHIKRKRTRRKKLWYQYGKDSLIASSWYIFVWTFRSKNLILTVFVWVFSLYVFLKYDHTYNWTITSVLCNVYNLIRLENGNTKLSAERLYYIWTSNPTIDLLAFLFLVSHFILCNLHSDVR